MVKNRRSELEIITNILDLSKEGSKKTKILYAVNLSYTQLQSYLPFLIEKEVLEECFFKDNGSSCKVYKTTSKGLDLLESAKKTLCFLRWTL